MDFRQHPTRKVVSPPNTPTRRAVECFPGTTLVVSL